MCQKQDKQMFTIYHFVPLDPKRSHATCEPSEQFPAKQNTSGISVLIRVQNVLKEKINSS